jgi:hypothetical protein
MMEMINAEVERSGGEAPHSAQALLRDFLQSNDRVQSERALALLFSNHAEPQVRRILRRRMSAMGAVERQNLDDLCSHVLLNLLRYLRQLQADAAKKKIDEFSSYAAAIAYRGYSDYLRHKYPRRHRVKTQLRRLFHVDHRLEVLRTSQNEWICRLARVNDEKRAVTLDELRALSSEFGVGTSPPKPAEFIVKLLRRIAAPVELDDLVGFVTEVWGVRDARGADMDEAGDVASPAPPPGSDVVDVRRRLETLWPLVRALPVRQRHALLLHLSDGDRGSALTLLPAIGIASILDIADVLEVSNAELRSIWNDLPMDDLGIARRLEMSRQQVINLRKSARARLARHTR